MKLLPLRDIFPPAQQVCVCCLPTQMRIARTRQRAARNYLSSLACAASIACFAQGKGAVRMWLMCAAATAASSSHTQSEDGCVEVQELTDVQQAQPDALCAKGGAGATKHGSSKPSSAPSSKTSWLGRIFGCHSRLAAT